MLQVDLRELARGPVGTQAELAADDPLFEGLGLGLAGPVPSVTVVLKRMSNGMPKMPVATM